MIPMQFLRQVADDHAEELRRQGRPWQGRQGSPWQLIRRARRRRALIRWGLLMPPAPPFERPTCAN